MTTPRPSVDERVKELEKLLRRLEWLPDGSGNLRCPECFGHALHEPGCALRAALSGAPLRTSRLSDAELPGDPARTVSWPADQGAAQQGRAPEAPLTPDESAAAMAFLEFSRAPAAAAPEAGAEAFRLLHSAVEVLSFYANLSPGMRADSDGSLAKAWLDAHPTIPAAPSPRPPEPEGRLTGTAYYALKIVDDAFWGDFCGLCGVVLSLESQDEDCGQQHTAVQLAHAWLERNPEPK